MLCCEQLITYENRTFDIYVKAKGADGSILRFISKQDLNQNKVTSTLYE